jgi:anaerobic ribonucleoside-triphosphate reductase activating protein
MKYKGVSDDKILLSGINPQSLVNGPGLRRVYFSQGCPHHCKGCFNKET